MENLTRTQIILLVLLVSFVTSLATGIVTVTLVNQAPQPITNTIGKVIEKTIERVVPGEHVASIIQPSAVVSSEENIVQIVQNYSSAVVSVVASKDMPVIEKYYINPFGDDPLFQQLPGLQIPQYRQNGTEKVQISSGSGFFVSADGLILTNKHVVADIEAEYTVIMNDGSKLGAKVLGRDPLQDIAILKVEGDKYNFIPLGNSDNLKIGQSVVAIGNALGEFQNTVSRGIISGLHREITASTGSSGTEELQELIQTDAAINKGNSGGPLLDLSGRVIGINTAMAQGAENVGFALTINVAKRDIDDVKQYGEIKYPYLGIRYQAVTAGIKEQKKLPVDYGLLLIKDSLGGPAILKDSPAEKAGLKEGDIIMEYNGTKILKNSTFVFLLSKSRIGDKINLKIWRDGKEINAEVLLAERT
ncbi:trypsin-like peptidase domain-containing protein [Patescibacteria group bacterium]|nr:trypsin-like peptidase domain-containing protein [Patescibacteria group bacterium]